MPVELLTCILFFSAADLANYYLAPFMFRIDMLIPFAVFFAVNLTGMRLYAGALMLGVFAGVFNGHILFMVALSLTIVYLLSQMKSYFMISSNRFIALFTAAGLLLLICSFYLGVYRGRPMPRMLVSQSIVYLLGNILLAPVICEAAGMFYGRAKKFYEKNIYHA